MSDDPSYYATRASEERRLAMASADQNVRRIHLEMAAKYDSLASPNGILGTEDAAEPEQRSA